MTLGSLNNGQHRTPAIEKLQAAKKERGGKSDAIAGLIFSVIGLPLCMFFLLSVIGALVSRRGMTRLRRRGGFWILATAGLVLGVAGQLSGIGLWYSGVDGCGNRERAMRAGCLNNLKQVTTAIITYRWDYGGSYPTHTPPDKDGKTDCRDLGILYPMYLTSLEVLSCPSSGDRMPERTSDAYDDKPFLPEEAKHVSYAYGLNKNANNKAWTEAAPRATRILADRPAGRPLTKRSNHKLDGRNVAFADGHVEWISGAALLDSDPENPNPTAHGTGPDWWSAR